MEVRHLRTLSNACSLGLLAFYICACSQPLPTNLGDLVSRLDHSFKTRQSSQVSPWVLSQEKRQELWQCPPEMAALLVPPTLFDLSEAWPMEPMQPYPTPGLHAPESLPLTKGTSFAGCQTQADVTLHKVVLRFGEQGPQKTLHVRVVEYKGSFYLLGF